MKNIFSIICFYLLFGSMNVYSQPNIDKKRDFAWIAGYQTNNHAAYPYSGTTLSDFNYCGANREFINTLMNFNGSSASMSDTSGNLLYYSNGIYIANRNNQKMLNGDSIGFCRLWQQDRAYGSTTVQGLVTIPKPNSNHIYYVLQANVDFLPNPALGYWHNGVYVHTLI